MKKKGNSLVIVAGLIALAVLGCCALGLLGNLLGTTDPALRPAQDTAPVERLATLTPTGAAIETPVPATIESLPTETPLPPTVAAAPADTPTCECSVDTYNCGDALADACFRHCLALGAGDVHGLDGDGDGIACQGD